MKSALSRTLRIILAAFDNPLSRTLEEQLRSLHHEIVGRVFRSDEALLLAEQIPCDLVLMGTHETGFGDYQRAARVIEQEFERPVIFLLENAEAFFVDQSELTDVCSFIELPSTEKALKSVFHLTLYKAKVESLLHKTALYNQQILDVVRDGIITIDDQGIIRATNKAACTIFGYDSMELIGQSASVIMPERFRAAHQGAISRQRLVEEYQEAATQAKIRDLQGLHRNGGEFPVRLSSAKITHGGKTSFIGFISDLSQQQRDIEEIHRLAYYDALTGLPNRRLLIERVDHARLTSLRNSRFGALMFIDLDHFKVLNDSAEPALGDALLVAVSHRLASGAREGDSVARLGGDEFVVLAEGLSATDHEAAAQAQLISKKILESLRQPYNLLGQTYVCTPSIGIVLFFSENQTTDELLKNADVAMYQAKAAGRNTARFFDKDLQGIANAHVSMKKDMLAGLAKREFLLHYQIQVNEEGVAIGAEALVRWAHPCKGLVPPFEFIPLAEESGIILELGQWVMEEACRTLVAWASHPTRQNWTIAVNVSVSQFKQANFVENVISALEQTGAAPYLLKLELTESMLVDNVEDIVVKMNAIKSLGVGFSLDDFGTGYSSLSNLKRLPLAQLKIDQSFVRDIMTDPSDAVIARTIVALGHNLGLKVIAEGVETREQHQFLREMGCDAFQGYYFARPVAFDALRDFPILVSA